MLDLPLIRALCFDMDGTLSDTDDHIVQRLASVLDALPLVSGRRAERLARQAVMAAETPVHAAYAKLLELGLGVPRSWRAPLQVAGTPADDPGAWQRPGPDSQRRNHRRGPA
jgi:phosphoglycolate phosphatase-like HAD superfamily hydrolase